MVRYNYAARMAQREHEAAMAILAGKVKRTLFVLSSILLASSVMGAILFALFMAARIGSNFACN